MCIEDIRLGRGEPGNHVSITVGLASAEAVPYREDRVSLIFCTPATQPVTLAHKVPAVVGEGITITLTQKETILTVRDHGKLVLGPWNAITVVAPTRWSFIETTEELD